MNVDVSVIIPTFRRPQQLVEAVRSALDQQGVQIEVRIIDDSPEGASRDAALELRDPRVTYVKRAEPSNGKPGIVRNEGWPLARGRYVHFLDDDDVLVREAYRAHVEALDAHPDRWMSFGRLEAFEEDAEAVEREAAFWLRGGRRARRVHRLGRKAMTAVLLFQSAVFANSACMIRRRLLDDMGGFDPSISINEETDLHIRGIRKYGFVFVDRPVVRYRVSKDSLGRSRNTQHKLVEAYRYIQQKYRATHGTAEFFLLKAAARLARPFL